jgi:hypothetical protein
MTDFKKLDAPPIDAADPDNIRIALGLTGILVRYYGVSRRDKTPYDHNGENTGFAVYVGPYKRGEALTASHLKHTAYEVIQREITRRCGFTPDHDAIRAVVYADVMAAIGGVYPIKSGDIDYPQLVGEHGAREASPCEQSNAAA